MRKLIGFTGYARSGKDTAAEFLVSERGFQRVAFADKLRESAYAVDPYVSTAGIIDPTTGEPAYVGDSYDAYMRLSSVIDAYGWEVAKQSDDVRRTLLRLGTEGGREIHGHNVWVNLAMKHMDELQGNVVLSDVRFPNEVAAIHEHGGFVIRVNRPGTEPAQGHISDTGIDALDIDSEINNDGTLEEFKENVLALESFYEELRRSQFAVVYSRTTDGQSKR